MERQEISDKVIKIVRSKLQLEDEKQVKEETTFAADLGTDSLDLAELVMEFEEEFELQIPDDTAKGAKSIKDAVDMIHEMLSRQGR